MSAVDMTRRNGESGRSVEIALASVALVTAVAALVVALTREPHATQKNALTPFIASVRVPNVVGKTSANAVHDLTDVRLLSAIESRKSATVPSGVVFVEMPAAAVAVPPGTTVTLIVSAGFP